MKRKEISFRTDGNGQPQLPPIKGKTVKKPKGGK